MEEVDRIIIHTLKDIGCLIEDDIRSLGQFGTDLVFEASVRCLEKIMPTITIPVRLPENVAARFQHCASVAESCKAIGYKSEIGYQTFLYSNVSEFRKVLMFLIDKLPREAEKPIPSSQDALSKTKQLIGVALRKQMNERSKADNVRSIPFVSIPIETGITYPGKITSMNPQEWREYCKNDLRWLTEQCPPSQLFSSVCRLNDTESNEFYEIATGNSSAGDHRVTKPKPKPRTRLQTPVAQSTWLSMRTPLAIPRMLKGSSEEEVAGTSTITENHVELDVSEEDKKELILEDINQSKNRIAQARLALQVLTDQLYQLKAELANQSGDKLKKAEARQRATALLSVRDSSIVADAQHKVNEKKEKLNVLTQQWQAHSQPLHQSLTDAQYHITNKQTELEKQVSQLEKLNKHIDEMDLQISLKVAQKAKLEAELSKAPKEIHRSMYTQRILEIIGSIKKQKDDIDKILKDTRQVQKEISITSGKLDRCYTVVDELIFKNAKKDEHSRRAYKLLATLHSDCNDIVVFIKETGELVREISILQEQTEMEASKKVGASLARITSDLKQMRAETEMLKSQLETLSK